MGNVMADQVASRKPTPTESVHRFLKELSQEPHIKAKLIEVLTPRQRQILDMLLQGDSNRTIAHKLNLTESTVKFSVRGLIRQLKTNPNLFGQLTYIDNDFPQSKVGEIDSSLTFTKEAMHILNFVAENAVLKAREHNDEIERLLSELQALREEASNDHP
jgi:DNA-binding CsgD family transcriptional regulator